MTIKSYVIRPGISGSGAGDQAQVMNNTGGADEPHNVSPIFLGSQFNGTFNLPRVLLSRFEVDMPSGAIILGLKLRWYSNLSSLGTTIDLTGGFTKRQGTTRPWEALDGVAVWNLQSDIPFGQSNDSGVGVQDHHEVFVNDAPAFENETAVIITTNFSEWSIGEGTQNSGTAFNTTGMIAQLQSYLDDPAVEATRGDTQVGSISVLFQVYRNYVGASDQYQKLRTQNSLNQVFHPALILEYGFEPVVTITNPLLPVTVETGTNINFVAASIDVEDGDISSGIIWTSDLDGVLGTGASINVNTLSIGDHVVTATSIDSDAQIGTDTTLVSVAPIADVGNIYDVVARVQQTDVTAKSQQVSVTMKSQQVSVLTKSQQADVTQKSQQADVTVKPQQADVVAGAEDGND